MTVVGGVPRSGEQIQAALVAFVGDWKNYQGTEKAEAQTFLNQLFACYGTDRNAVGAKFEDFRSSAGFMDLHWPQACIIEMKAPSRARSLYQAREQVMRYWRESADEVNDRPAARYVCSAHSSGSRSGSPDASLPAHALALTSRSCPTATSP